MKDEILKGIKNKNLEEMDLKGMIFKNTKLAQWIKFVANSEEKLEKSEYYKFFMQGWLEAVNNINELKKVEI